MAFIGNDFWGVQAGFCRANSDNHTACTRVTITCTGQLQYQNIQFPMGMASDGVRYIYFSPPAPILFAWMQRSQVFIADPALMQVWSKNGLLNGKLTAYSLLLVG